MYARILYALSRPDSSLGSQEPGGLTTKQASRFRNQVARMLILNGSIFFICQVHNAYKICIVKFVGARYCLKFLNMIIASQYDHCDQNANILKFEIKDVVKFFFYFILFLIMNNFRH